MFKLLLCLFTISLFSALAPAQDLTLPIYRLYISPDELENLENNPRANVTSPGEVEFEGERLACRLRFRGTTARNLPKKSWKIALDEPGPNGWRTINLNSEYRDLSLSRNFLSLSLARWAGLPASEARHISLFVNDRYYGVYLEVEEVDEEFYQRRGLSVRYIFKAIKHASRFCLPTIYSQFDSTYEEIYVGAYDIDTLGADFSKFTGSNKTRDWGIARALLDSELLIKYFALTFISANTDGFTKNYYVIRLINNTYLFTPWDCDATWGNTCDGRFAVYAREFCFGGLQQNAAIQVLLEEPDYTSRFNQEIRRLALEGFDFLHQLQEETLDQIVNDLQYDTLQRGDVDQVIAEFDRIRGWMDARREFLLNFQYPPNRDFKSVSLNTHYLNNRDDTLHAEAVLAEEPLFAALVFCDADGDMLRVDLCAQDSLGLYHRGAFQLSELDFPLRYAWAIEQPDYHYFYLPFCGSWFSNWVPLSQSTIRIDPDPPAENDVSFTEFYIEPGTQTFYFGLTNQRERPLNLSGCWLSLNDDYRRIQIPEMLPLEADESVYFSNHPEYTQVLRPNEQVGGKFYFQPQIDDTLTALNCDETIIAQMTVERILPQNESVGAVVVNEINYDSAPQFDPGDWVELYVREGPVDFSGWTINDERYDHTYAFPAGFIRQTGDYIIVAVSPETFRRCFPNVPLVLGGFEWGFGGNDQVRLFDRWNGLVDWVAYDNDDPWPFQPDGNGPTLELINPHQANFNYDSWRASTALYGSPGARNSVFTGAPPTDEMQAVPSIPVITSIYPNPGNERIRITISGFPKTLFPLVIYNLNGRLIREFPVLTNTVGKGWTEWEGCDSRGVPAVSGVYWAGWKNHPGEWRKVVLIK